MHVNYKGYKQGDVSIYMYQNVQSQLTPASGHSEPDYATAAGAFINPASAMVPSRPTCTSMPMRQIKGLQT